MAPPIIVRAVNAVTLLTAIVALAMAANDVKNWKTLETGAHQIEDQYAEKVKLNMSIPARINYMVFASAYGVLICLIALVTRFHSAAVVPFLFIFEWVGMLFMLSASICITLMWDASILDSNDIGLNVPSYYYQTLRASTVFGFFTFGGLLVLASVDTFGKKLRNPDNIV